MGRPISDEPRDKTVCVRFTEAELREITAKVPRGRSEALRRLVLGWVRDEPVE